MPLWGSRGRIWVQLPSGGKFVANPKLDTKLRQSSSEHWRRWLRCPTWLDLILNRIFAWIYFYQFNVILSLLFGTSQSGKPRQRPTAPWQSVKLDGLKAEVLVLAALWKEKRTLPRRKHESQSWEGDVKLSLVRPICGTSMVEIGNLFWCGSVYLCARISC